jgi:hypothetical protein
MPDTAIMDTLTYFSYRHSIVTLDVEWQLEDTTADPMAGARSRTLREALVRLVMLLQIGGLVEIACHGIVLGTFTREELLKDLSGVEHFLKRREAMLVRHRL